MDTSKRYNRIHRHGDVEFFLPSIYPDQQECRFLLLKVVEQAARDYVTLFESPSQRGQDLWETAKGFLFEESHRINWGEKRLSTEDILDILDLDVEWFRECVKRKFEKKHDKHREETTDNSGFNQEGAR